MTARDHNGWPRLYDLVYETAEQVRKMAEDKTPLDPTNPYTTGSHKAANERVDELSLEVERLNNRIEVLSDTCITWETRALDAERDLELERRTVRNHEDDWSQVGVALEGFRQPNETYVSAIARLRAAR